MGIIVDGTPFALVLPCLFAENFVTMDDYTHKPYFSAFLPIIRFFAFIAGAVLPGLYVALCNFHPEMFRSALLLNIYSSQQTAAYPVFGECLIMYILYEIMREAGLRLPQSIRTRRRRSEHPVLSGQRAGRRSLCNEWTNQCRPGRTGR